MKWHKEIIDPQYAEVEKAKQRVEIIIVDGIKYKKCCKLCKSAKVGWVSSEYGVMDYKCQLFGHTVIGYDYMVCDKFGINLLKHKDKISHIKKNVEMEQSLANANFRSY